MTGHQKSLRKRRTRNHPGKKFWVLLLQILAVFMVSGLVVTSLFAGKMVIDALKTLPAISGSTPMPTLSSEIYDASGRVIKKIYLEQNRQPVRLADVPKHVQDAFVAVEDKNFWTHKGVDIQAVIRALYNDLRNQPLQGASTITQQLARNAFPIGNERSVKRKIQEAFLALELERRYTKKQILEMYLQQIYFGQDAYGLEAASQTYFNKPAKMLTLEEGALLAGLPQAPSVYEPINNPDAAKKRRNLVLDLMAKNGFITQKQADEAKQKPVKTAPRKQKKEVYEAGHFVDYVLVNLLKKYPANKLYQGGLKIYTTLDRDIQLAAEAAIAKHMDKEFPLDSGKEQPQAALVVIENETGYIRAMVGGRSHTRALELNRAWYDPDAGCCARQPGSAFKPLAVYIPALGKGYTAATVIDDSLKTYKTPEGAWSPANYDHRYRGLTTLREAVRRSVNTVAVKLLEQIGVREGYLNAARMGITTLIPDGPKNDVNLSIALGGLTKGASVLDMARAYAAIANGGKRVEPIAVLAIRDSHGNVIERNDVPLKTQVIKPEVAYLMTDILRSVVEPQPGGGWIENWGTGSAAKPKNWPWPVAGKTGTTSDMKDVWFVGFTPKYTAAVWIGYDNATKSDSLPKSITSSKHPAWIWRDVMFAAHSKLKPFDFAKPKGFKGFVTRAISVKSGKLAGPDTPPEWVRNEVFIPGTEPKEVDDAWLRLTVCQEQPDRLYAEACGCIPVEKVFLKRPNVEGDPKKLPEDLALAPPTLTCLDQPAPPGDGKDNQGSQASPAPPINKVIEVAVDQGRISPPIIRLRVGEQTTLRFASTSGGQQAVPGEGHEVLADELGLSVRLEPGGTGSLTVKPDRAGVYLIRCKNHDTEVARLIVEP